MKNINKNRSGYKKTSLGWLPIDWSVKKLDKLSKIDVNNLNSNTNPNYKFKYITLSDIENGKVKKEIQEIIYSDSPSRARRIVGKNDVLIGTVRPYLKPFAYFNLEDKPYIASTGFSVVKTNNELNSMFLYNLLFSKFLENQFEALVVGSNYPAINSSDVKNLLIPLPPLPEQKKIAEILSTWDKAISTTEELIEKLKLRKKGLMQQLLTGKTRLNGFSGKWKKMKLRDVSERIFNKNTELNDTVVTISAKRGFVLQEDFFNKRVASDTLSGYYLIEKGEFAYNKSYSKGYPMGAFKRLDELEKAVVTTLYICFKLTKKVDSNFMLNYFEGGLLVNNLMKIAKEGGRAHGLLNISLDDFFSLEIKIPELIEQKAIAEILSTVDIEIKLYEEYLSQLQTQKKGLMQKLLTGEIRVKVEEEEI